MVRKLRKFVARKPQRWSALLLFGKIPQSSMGFSPFVIFFNARQFQGILDLLHETWQTQGMTSQNAIQYILKL